MMLTLKLCGYITCSLTEDIVAGFINKTDENKQNNYREEIYWDIVWKLWDNIWINLDLYYDNVTLSSL